MWISSSSEGLANNLSAPLGRVDSTSTTGPVFKSNESKADLATVRRVGRVKESRAKGRKGMVLLHRSLSLFSCHQCCFECVGFHEFLWPLLDFHTNVYYLYRGTKGRSNHFSTSGHVLFSWLKQHVFFWLRGVVQQCSLLCRSNSKSMKAAEHRVRSHRKIHFYTLGVKQNCQKEDWAIYADGWPPLSV